MAYSPVNIRADIPRETPVERISPSTLIMKHETSQQLTTGKGLMPLLARTSPLRSARIPKVRQRVDEAELLDAEDHDLELLRGNLQDIRRVNRFFGGTAAIMRHLPALADPIPRTKTITILDLATGAADIPLEIARWAEKTGRLVHICASDASPDILSIAREHTSDDQVISLAQYDARSVPLPDHSFDIVLCSLALHHFPPVEASMVLREMDRLAVYGFIVNDLRRSRSGYLAVLTASRLTTRNPLTRHDAPLSVRKAYTPSELRWLLQQAGVTGAQVLTAPCFRMVAVKGKR